MHLRWLVPIPVLLAGCSLSPSADVIRELAKDPATASVTILSPYGQIRWTRTNPPPGQSVTVGPDGTITVK
jgi:hypothetical protein